MLHCLKLARYRFFFGNITLNYDRTDYLINSKKLESNLYLGPILTDDSSVGKIKDYYALKLFCFDNLEKLFEMDYRYELVYFIPFTCWAEAITNQNINCQIRIVLLRIAFNFLYAFFVQNILIKRSKGITITNSKNSIAKVFADEAFLIRSINSIIGLASILTHYSDVGVDRVGTHVFENFFGQIRYSCKDLGSI